MVKREIIRIVVAAILGLSMSFFLINNDNKDTYYLLLFMPVYFVGMFYAGKLLWNLLCWVIKTFFTCQFMSLLINPLWGTLLSLILLCLGLLAILSFAWVIGLGKCMYCIISAVKIDKECKRSSVQFDYW